MMSINIDNQPQPTTVFIPDLLLHGTSSEQYGIIQVTCDDPDNVFPTQDFEVNVHHFKLLVHLEPGFNNLTFTQYSGTYRNGFPKYDEVSNYPPIVKKFQINYRPMVENPELQLCLLVAKDSPGIFDSPPDRIAKEGNNIQTAIRKMKFGARLMQAFTSEQMRRNNFGNRCFKFAEEYNYDTISIKEQGKVKRNTVKVHIIRMEQTLAEIHDPNVAQQNPNGNNTGALFCWAANAVRKYISENPQYTSFQGNDPQAACIYLDAHWDNNQKLLLGHAALGGCSNDLRLAIFGSHGLWSWPNCYEELYHAFCDETKTDLNYCCNDNNECGSSWEALNITLGAFLHEIGHNLGCPHQPNGVMLRDYVTFNRTFMTREFPSTRTGSRGYAPVMPKDECTWNRLDIMRFLYHDDFRLPVDYKDSTLDLNSWQKGESPRITAINSNGRKGLVLEAHQGIYLIELHVDGDPRSQIEYHPRLANGGPGPQREVVVYYDELQNRLPNEFKNKPLKLEVLACGLKQSTVEDFLKA